MPQCKMCSIKLEFYFMTCITNIFYLNLKSNNLRQKYTKLLACVCLIFSPFCEMKWEKIFTPFLLLKSLRDSLKINTYIHTYIPVHTYFRFTSIPLPIGNTLEKQGNTYIPVLIFFNKMHGQAGRSHLASIIHCSVKLITIFDLASSFPFPMWVGYHNGQIIANT